jgi:mRNA-degrading endonuclease YafQ of YafQ-DinJ toxin-antitoxin module
VKYQHLDFTDHFLSTLLHKGFSRQEQQLFLKALRLLDENEQHPSLRVHQLRGDQEGVWSASASEVLRVRFLRTADGRKELLDCSRHYRT